MSTAFWPWWLGGLAVGAVAVLQPWLSGRLLGVSSMYASLIAPRHRSERDLSELERTLLVETEREFGTVAPGMAPSEPRSGALGRLRLEAERFRPLFLVGMIAGAALAALASDRWQSSLSLGARFDARYGDFGGLSIVTLLLSGVLIGFGTRLGGGCTSGHGVSGIARGESGSVVTTAAFWLTALGVTGSIVGWKAIAP